jgi:hypothetical protein
MRPTVPDVAERWYQELAVTQPGDDERDWPLLKILGACGSAFGRLHDVVRDTDAGLGWTMLLDPARCPGWALPWLAQFAGVKLVTGSSEAQQRAQITAPPAFNRGTRSGMQAAVAATLTGTKQVRVVERADGDPYRLAVITAPESPDTAATARAAAAQKPIGLLLNMYVSTTPLLMEYTRPLSAVIATIGTATVADVT